MDLTTHYLGFRLPHPLIAGASPLSGHLDSVRRLEDAGAAAIVMSSLFEEELFSEQLATHYSLDLPAESFAEAQTYFPGHAEFALGPDDYLEHLHAVKQAVGIPVIGSLNGTTPGGWLECAQSIAQAGADAIELNVYRVVTDLDRSATEVEDSTVEMVTQLTAEVNVPVAIKLSPFYSALPHFAARLDRAGAKGLILFNRFYQPDIDVEQLEVTPSLHLSDSSELLLRVHWLAILSGLVSTSLAVSGGVHCGLDAVKSVMAGAHAVQMVSALLRNGPDHLRTVREELARWLVDHEYESLGQMHGSMNFLRCPNPSGLERMNHMRMLKSWESPLGAGK
jgi:dihydroorotate dehydrogenase (fumarate)